MKRFIIFVVTIASLGALMWGSAGCGGAAAAQLDEDLSESEIEELQFFENFTFQSGFPAKSTCFPNNITENVLSAFTDENFTRFELRRTDESLYLAGDLEEDQIFQFSEFANGIPVQITDGSIVEDAICFMRFVDEGPFSPLLHQECESESFICVLEWL